MGQNEGRWRGRRHECEWLERLRKRLRELSDEETELSFTVRYGI